MSAPARMLHLRQGNRYEKALREQGMVLVDGQSEVAADQEEMCPQSLGRGEEGASWVGWKFRAKQSTVTGDGLGVEERRRRNESRRGIENPGAVELSCFLPCACSPQT